MNRIETKQNILSQFGEILENYDINCIELYNWREDYYVATFQMYSPLGEDIEFTIHYDGTNKDFAREFIKYYESFDVDDHVEIWIPNRGTNGIPKSIRELVEDAEAIEKILESVSDQIEEKVFGRKITIKELFPEYQ